MDDGRIQRECPRCGNSAIVSRRESERVYSNNTRIQSLFEQRPSVTHACASCSLTGNF